MLESSRSCPVQTEGQISAMGSERDHWGGISSVTMEGSSRTCNCVVCYI